MIPTIVTCPHCNGPLDWGNQIICCPTGHQFDRARQGYVNLYIPAGRPPQIRGDSRAMLTARRRFLESGHYAPLSERLIALLRAECQLERPTILDAGCGEGHYLRQITAALNGHGVGFDRSKEAARLAAGRDKKNIYFVADIWQHFLCQDNAVDILLNIFAPRHPGEFRRVLRRDGLLAVVTPEPEHLLTIRRDFGLIGQAADKAAQMTAMLAVDFQPVLAERCEFKLTLSGPDLLDLLQMMPAARHFPQARQLEVQSEPQYTVACAFHISLWRPGPQESQ